MQESQKERILKAHKRIVDSFKKAAVKRLFFGTINPSSLPEKRYGPVFGGGVAEEAKRRQFIDFKGNYGQ